MERNRDVCSKKWSVAVVMLHFLFAHINISSLLMCRAGLYVGLMYGGFLEKI